MQLGMTVRELLERVDSLELAEWVAFNSIEPIGDFRNDLHAGIIASTMANCHAPKGKSFNPADFMPLQDSNEPEVQSEDVMKEKMLQLAKGSK